MAGISHPTIACGCSYGVCHKPYGRLDQSLTRSHRAFLLLWCPSLIVACIRAKYRAGIPFAYHRLLHDHQWRLSGFASLALDLRDKGSPCFCATPTIPPRVFTRQRKGLKPFGEGLAAAIVNALMCSWVRDAVMSRNRLSSISRPRSHQLLQHSMCSWGRD